MSITSSITSLKSGLSSSSEILTNPDDASFQELSKRWTDVGRQTPAAIVLPTSEEDCQKTVKWAVDSSIPFVTRSGGHSEWSTIDSSGIIIDLSRYSGVEVDKAAKTATLTGGVLAKQVATTLAEAGLFIPLGSSNTVGAIPFTLGGGASITASLTGFAADGIISARLITAKGDLVDVTKDQHPDLLWAIRGAGQFFGLITQLVVKAYPFSVLGNDQGSVWLGSFIFPLERVKEVSSAVKAVVDNSHYPTGGLFMVMAPPPARKPLLIIGARFFGDPKTVQEAYKPLYDLGPIAAPGQEVLIQNANDSRAAQDTKGGLKKFGSIGLQHFDEESFLKTVDIWKELTTNFPDAINSFFSIQWDSRPVKTPDFESAMSHHDIRFWQNNLVFFTDEKNRSKVEEYNSKALDAVRGPSRETWADFPGSTRTGPIELRYRGGERLNRLTSLKKEWDPTGVFTNQLLE